MRIYILHIYFFSPFGWQGGAPSKMTSFAKRTPMPDDDSFLRRKTQILTPTDVITSISSPSSIGGWSGSSYNPKAHVILNFISSLRTKYLNSDIAKIEVYRYFGKIWWFAHQTCNCKRWTSVYMVITGSICMYPPPSFWSDGTVILSVGNILIYFAFLSREIGWK